MYITCLDVEGVLVPEIWVAFAEESGIPELKKTTRDEPDYDKLMKWRLGVLKEHGLGLKEIQETIEKIQPLPGAKEFLDELRSFSQVRFRSAKLFVRIQTLKANIRNSLADMDSMVMSRCVSSRQAIWKHLMYLSRL